MERAGNAAMVRYEDSMDNIKSDPKEEAPPPITLDVIAREQSNDSALALMITKAPSVFSTATNGSIQLITARGKDGKYRIVIPKSLQAKVLKTYHDCLVNPTKENNFKKVLYVHFTWNGIHKDVENYVLHEGLTDEMKSRGRRVRPSDERGGLPIDEISYHSNQSDDMNGNSSYESLLKTCDRPIGLDEIAKEQKKDKELRHLKKEEPFVFSTVRYGNTLLTTAQNFRDNKYRIVIPRQLQGRMMKTYEECLMNPTPDRNFDTLLYNHFTWNGIHDDVDYFVKNGGHLPPTKELGNGYHEGSKASLLFARKSKSKENVERSSSHDDEEYLDWIWENERFERKITIIRMVFLLCGFLAIISSILFLTRGIGQVVSSLNGVQLSLEVSQFVWCILFDVELLNITSFIYFIFLS